MSDSQATGSPPRWTVLVVDDDPDVHPLLEMLFQVDGRFELVGSAHDGAAALDQVARRPPDAVVVDLSSADPEEWEALPRLRQEAPAARIIVFSAFPEIFTLADALAAGADAYLNKASVWELIPVMAQLLGDDSP